MHIARINTTQPHPHIHTLCTRKCKCKRMHIKPHSPFLTTDAAATANASTTSTSSQPAVSRATIIAAEIDRLVENSFCG